MELLCFTKVNIACYFMMNPKLDERFEIMARLSENNIGETYLCYYSGIFAINKEIW